jgi:hypothetical protein
MADKPIYKYFRCPTPKCGYKQRDYTGKQKGKCPKCGEVCYVTDNWYASYTNAQGKPREKACTPAYEDAKAFLEEVSRSKRLGQLLPDERGIEQDILWDDAVKPFLAEAAQSTYANTRRMLTMSANNLTESFSGVVLQDITVAQLRAHITRRQRGLPPEEIERRVERFRTSNKHLNTWDMSRKITALRRHHAPIGNATIVNEINVFFRVFRDTLAHYQSRKYPNLYATYHELKLGIKSDMPKINNKKTRVPEEEQFLNLLDRTGTYGRMILIIGAKMWLRPANIYSLRKCQINFECREVVIQRKDMKIKGKNTSEFRRGFDEEMSLIFKKYILENGIRDYLFPSPRNPNKPITRSASIEKAIKALGLNDGVTDRRKKITLYTATRHAGATWFYRKTGDLQATAEGLDHKNSDFTRQTYAHEQPDTLRALWDDHSVKIGERKGEKG